MTLYVVEVSVILLVSLSGFCINAHFLFNISKMRQCLNTFQKLCFAKALSNTFICASMQLWAIPLSAFSFNAENIWRYINIAIASLTASGCYLFGPMCQILMAVNRVIILYFPFSNKRFKKVPYTHLAVTVCIATALYFAIAGMYGKCALVYHPDTLAWTPENSKCADSMDGGQLPIVILFTATSILLNCLAVFRLLYDNVSGISAGEKMRRRNKWISSFIQNVIQDALHVTDMINYTFIYKLVDANWFQFIFLSLSFVLIYALDGIVMTHFFIQQRNTNRKAKLCTVSTQCIGSSRPI